MQDNKFKSRSDLTEVDLGSDVIRTKQIPERGQSLRCISVSISPRLQQSKMSKEKPGSKKCVIFNFLRLYKATTLPFDFTAAAVPDKNSKGALRQQLLHFYSLFKDTLGQRHIKSKNFPFIFHPKLLSLSKCHLESI